MIVLVITLALKSWLCLVVLGPVEDKSLIFVFLFIEVYLIIRDSSNLRLFYCFIEGGCTSTVVPVSDVYRSIEDRCKLILLSLFLPVLVALSLFLRIHVSQQHGQRLRLSTLTATA